MSALVQRSFAGWKRPGRGGRRRGVSYRPKRIRIDREWLRVEYVDKMRTAKDIAKEMGCGKTTVLHHLREYDIPVLNANERRRKTTDDYHGLAKDRGCEWVGPERPANSSVKTWWRCSQGHQWEARYRDFKRGIGCPSCFGKVSGTTSRTAPKTSDDYHALAKEHDLEWIDAELPVGVIAKSLWRCSQDHQWLGRYSNIQQGHGCPHCAGHISKTVRDYHILAEDRGFEWIGDELPTSIAANTWWQCSQSHQWKTRYNSIRQGMNCPYCTGVLPKKTVEDYYTLAREHGFEWVGFELPANNSTKTQWQCSQGHQWETRYNSIKKGSSCPVCYRENRKGRNSPNWQGGISFEPYSPRFNDKLKLAIRVRDDFTCQLSDEPENGKAYSIHHIDYDKKNSHHWNLITLCHSEHGKTGGGDRDAWQWKLSALIFAKYSQGDIRWVGGDV